MPSHLLDKNVARRMIEALHHRDALTFEEEMVLGLWRQLKIEKARLFVPVAAMNILHRFAHLAEVCTFLAAVEPLGSGRYLRRWAHRLREHGFTREDALILAWLLSARTRQGPSSAWMFSSHWIAPFSITFRLTKQSCRSAYWQ